ncbi:MAG: secretion system protein [Candidatus Atribacteria bacterium]|nr:MAG: secretion system protein [Candidatus Atribacteria bacterium]
MANAYFSFAYNIFGEFYQKKRSNYYGLRQNILKSRMNMGYDMYLSGTLLTSIICALVGLILLNVIFSQVGVPEISSNRLHLPLWTAEYSEYKVLAVQIIGSIFVAVSFFGVVYQMFLAYPAIIASERKGKIDHLLPYAVNYMSAMSGSGVLPLDLFRALAANKICGEVSVETRYLVRDIEVLGHNLLSGMKNLLSTTPSLMLQDFLQGAITVVSSGGELEPYFKIKTEQYLIENRQRQKEFLETLGLLAETYVTAFVAGPLFLIIVIAVMSMMGSADMLFLYLLVYAIVPIGSIMFIVLINTMTPEA